MGKRFRIQHVRANIPTPQGTIYPEEVMQYIVENAKKLVEERSLFVYVHIPEKPSGDIRDTLGFVTDIDLVYGWIEVEIEPIRIDGKFNPLDQDNYACVIIPSMAISRSSREGYLIVYEATIQHFTLDLLPSEMDKSVHWGKKAKRIVGGDT